MYTRTDICKNPPRPWALNTLELPNSRTVSALNERHWAIMDAWDNFHNPPATLEYELLGTDEWVIYY